ARGAPVDHMGGFGNAQRNAVTAAAVAITLTRRIAEPGRTEQPFRRGKMAATGPGRADHIGGSARGYPAGFRPPRPAHPAADLSQQRIKRRAILGGLIYEYQ